MRTSLWLILQLRAHPWQYAPPRRALPTIETSDLLIAPEGFWPKRNPNRMRKGKSGELPRGR